MVDLMGDDSASRVDDPRVRRRPFGNHSVRVDEPSFIGAVLPGKLTREDVGQQRNRLDIDPLPAQVRRGDDADPFARGVRTFSGST